MCFTASHSYGSNTIIENRRNYQITKLMKINIDYQIINATVLYFNLVFLCFGP